MVVTDASWYVVRNTPRVTGFIGAGNIPVPVSPEEMKIIQKRMGQEETKFKIDLSIDDNVKKGKLRRLSYNKINVLTSNGEFISFRKCLNIC